MRTFRKSTLGTGLASICAMIAGACANIPGETLAPRGLHSEIRDRIYAHARSIDPQCRQQKIGNTEVVELHPAGTVAVERWTVENCRSSLVYIVSFPARATPGGGQFQVQPER